MWKLFTKRGDSFQEKAFAKHLKKRGAVNVPLSILTVAAMLPANWNKRRIDLNVSALTDDDIRWADYVFISAMLVQLGSVKQIIERCQQLNTKAGGVVIYRRI